MIKNQIFFLILAVLCLSACKKEEAEIFPPAPARLFFKFDIATNKSFEWKDTNGNGKWDATKGEPVVDMGLRGMILSIQ